MLREMDFTGHLAPNDLKYPQMRKLSVANGSLEKIKPKNKTFELSFFFSPLYSKCFKYFKTTKSYYITISECISGILLAQSSS